jgi:hypothetical protein
MFNVNFLALGNAGAKASRVIALAIAIIYETVTLIDPKLESRRAYVLPSL